MARDTFSVPILHIYSSVGYCVVYFCLGFVRAFYQINEIDSTLEPMIICYCVENQIYLSGTIYGHEIEMYTVEQGEKRDKRQ